MAANDSNKDKAMAANLRSKGIYHGVRRTTTHAPPRPAATDVGSAAYRRRMASKLRRNSA